MISLLFLAVYC